MTATDEPTRTAEPSFTSEPVSAPDVDDDTDLLAWRNTFLGVFSMAAGTVAELDLVRVGYRPQRLTGVRADGRWVATFRSWRGDSAVPGPALLGGASEDTRTVATELISTVSVVPTHRRRGLLRTLMLDCLDHARDTGAVVASLFASEAPIYGRFGFGVASHTYDYTVDTRAARQWHPAAPVDPGRMRLSDDDELLALGPPLFDAARRSMPGAVGRNDVGWQRLLERLPPGTGPDGPRVRAVHLDPAGQVDGYVRLRTESAWSGGMPAFTARVDDLVGATPAVDAALWRFCVDLDLVTTLVAENRGHGELLPHLPVDSRSVRLTTAVDGTWWRVLDPAAALRTRAWAAPGRVVLEVIDEAGPAAGRWLLDADETGVAEVTPTSQPADVTVPVQTLPGVLTGVLELAPRVRAGLLDEHSPGALARLERMARVSPVALATVQGF